MIDIASVSSSNCLQIYNVLLMKRKHKNYIYIYIERERERERERGREIGHYNIFVYIIYKLVKLSFYVIFF